MCVHVCVCVCVCARARVCVCVCVFVLSSVELVPKDILVSKESEHSQGSTRQSEICLIANNKMHVPYNLTKNIFSENFTYNISQC